jgi:hypothetical protein
VQSSTHVTGNHGLDATIGIDVVAKDHIRLAVGQSSIVIDQTSITITAGGKALLKLDTTVLAQSTALSSLFLDSKVLAHATGSAELLLEGQAKLTSSGKTHLTLDGNATLSSPGDVKVDGVNVTLTGTTKVAAGGGARNLELAAAGSDSLRTQGHGIGRRHDRDHRRHRQNQLMKCKFEDLRESGWLLTRTQPP